jgi:isopenicillin N synthase-like dioxygenase
MQGASSRPPSLRVGGVDIVDLGPCIANPTGALSHESAAAVVAALERSGVAVIVGHGVAPALVKRLDDLTRAFFRSSAVNKRACLPPGPDVLRGWQPVGFSRRYDVLDGDSADLVEFFVINRLDPVGDAEPRSAEARLWRAPNIWPEEPMGFRTIFETGYRVFTLLTERLMVALAVGLGLKHRYFAPAFERHFSNLVASYYLPQAGPAPVGAVRTSPRTDPGAFTVTYRDQSPDGLQVFHSMGWWEVPRVDNSFVIMAGDLIERWTGGRIKAAVHRAVNPPQVELAPGFDGRSRLSVKYFSQPNPEAIVGPIPGISAGEADYPGRRDMAAVRVGDFMKAKEMRLVSS